MPLYILGKCRTRRRRARALRIAAVISPFTYDATQNADGILYFLSLAISSGYDPFPHTRFYWPPPLKAYACAADATTRA